MVEGFQDSRRSRRTEGGDRGRYATSSILLHLQHSEVQASGKSH